MDEIQITVKQLELVATKLCLEPGDVLVFSYASRMRQDDVGRIQQSVRESFGVPAIVMQDGLKIEGVLSIAPSLVAEAERVRMEKADELCRRLMESAVPKETPVASVSYVDEKGERQAAPPNEGDRLMRFFKEGGA